jgi:hypothetical protein
MTRWRSVALLIAACCLAALPMPVENGWGYWTTGIFWLFFGWLSIFGPPLPWLGNLLIWVSLYGVWSDRPPTRSGGIVAAALLTLLVLTAFFWRETYSYPDPSRIVEYGAGYYCWILSMVAAAIAIFARSHAREENGTE